MDSENCTFKKCTHIHTHTKTHKKWFGFIYRCLIEIRAFKHNTGLVTIFQLNDEYIKTGDKHAPNRIFS